LLLKIRYRNKQVNMGACLLSSYCFYLTVVLKVYANNIRQQVRAFSSINVLEFDLQLETWSEGPSPLTPS
jgi:hypothetical protein